MQSTLAPIAGSAPGHTPSTTTSLDPSRRRVRALAVIAGLLLALAVVGPASAGKPEIEWYGEETLYFDGYCPFPVLLQDSRSSAKHHLFPVDAAGSQRDVAAGSFLSTFTNLATGATIEAGTAGSVEFLMTADALNASFSGKTLLWYSAQEAAASQLGQGLFIVTGRGFETWDQDGLVGAGYSGHVLDICEALSA